MKRNTWSNKDVIFLKKRARFDEQGFIANIPELSKELNRSPKTISAKAALLRQKGEFPKPYYDDPIQPVRKPYTKYEDRFIVNAVKQGVPTKEIAEALNRTHNAITLRINRLRKKTNLRYIRRDWSYEESKIIISQAKFDQYGYLSNVNELSRLVNRPAKAIYSKIHQMRKQGHIITLPDRSHTSQAAKKASDMFYQTHFSTKKESTPVSASVDKQ
ncbi:hypothetical protein [Enterococcus casseliflavus]|uniref:hypothetical protein n=1 Tax=Enterococcus casseliflavus TaxID=37734 RepID=UPI003D6B6B7E